MPGCSRSCLDSSRRCRPGLTLSRLSGDRHLDNVLAKFQPDHQRRSASHLHSNPVTAHDATGAQMVSLGASGSLAKSPAASIVLLALRLRFFTQRGWHACCEAPGPAFLIITCVAVIRACRQTGVIRAEWKPWMIPRLTCRRCLAIFDVEMDEPSAPSRDPPRIGLLPAASASTLTRGVTINRGLDDRGSFQGLSLAVDQLQRLSSADSIDRVPGCHHEMQHGTHECVRHIKKRRP